MDSFIPLLRTHIASTNPHVKELIVGWVTTLDSVPDIEMLDYLPGLLSGLFSMLTDSNKEVKKVASQGLQLHCFVFHHRVRNQGGLWCGSVVVVCVGCDAASVQCVDGVLKADLGGEWDPASAVLLPRLPSW